MSIYYCIEDDLSRAVAERLIEKYCPAGINKTELGKTYSGFGGIKKNFPKYYNLAQRSYVFIITDLDRAKCPPSLRRDWLKAANILEPLPEKMLFCIAQTEIESWLLADTNGISNFLKISQAKLKANIEKSVVDAKEYLVKLAALSSSADVRTDLAPAPKSNAATGLSYNFKLSQFAANDWNPDRAAENSLSLKRAIDKLSSFEI